MQPLRHSRHAPTVPAQQTSRPGPFPPTPISVRVVSVLDETMLGSYPNKQSFKSSHGSERQGNPRCRFAVLGLVVVTVLAVLTLWALRVTNQLTE